METSERRRLLGAHGTLRIVGFAILAAGLLWFGVTEGRALAPGVAVMALGAAVAALAILPLARFELRRDPKTRRAVRLLVAGSTLKLLAIPVVALGGGWLALGGWPGQPVAIGVLGLGLAAYLAGIHARIDGTCMLPTGADYG